MSGIVWYFPQTDLERDCWTQSDAEQTEPMALQCQLLGAVRGGIGLRCGPGWGYVVLIGRVTPLATT